MSKAGFSRLHGEGLPEGRRGGPHRVAPRTRRQSPFHPEMDSGIAGVRHRFARIHPPERSDRQRENIADRGAVPGAGKFQPHLRRGSGFPAKPMKIYPVEMAVYETPGELYQRRALREGSTYDEMSRLVESLKDAETVTAAHYPLIWLREMGRVHSSSVQGGLARPDDQGPYPAPRRRTIPGNPSPGSRTATTRRKTNRPTRWSRSMTP